jgi:hypothetical protein
LLILRLPASCFLDCCTSVISAEMMLEWRLTLGNSGEELDDTLPCLSASADVVAAHASRKAVFGYF